MNSGGSFLHRVSKWSSIHDDGSFSYQGNLVVSDLISLGLKGVTLSRDPRARYGSKFIVEDSRQCIQSVYDLCKTHFHDNKHNETWPQPFRAWWILVSLFDLFQSPQFKFEAIKQLIKEYKKHFKNEFEFPNYYRTILWRQLGLISIPSLSNKKIFNSDKQMRQCYNKVLNCINHVLISIDNYGYNKIHGYSDNQSISITKYSFKELVSMYFGHNKPLLQSFSMITASVVRLALNEEALRDNFVNMDFAFVNLKRWIYFTSKYECMYDVQFGLSTKVDTILLLCNIMRFGENALCFSKKYIEYSPQNPHRFSTVTESILCKLICSLIKLWRFNCINKHRINSKIAIACEYDSDESSNIITSFDLIFWLLGAHYLFGKGDLKKVKSLLAYNDYLLNHDESKTKSKSECTASIVFDYHYIIGDWKKCKKIMFCLKNDHNVSKQVKSRQLPQCRRLMRLNKTKQLNTPKERWKFCRKRFRDGTNFLHRVAIDSKRIEQPMFDLMFESPKNLKIVKNLAMIKQCQWRKCLKKHKRLRLCSNCKRATYCRRLCQKKDWNFGDHKISCLGFLQQLQI